MRRPRDEATPLDASAFAALFQPLRNGPGPLLAAVSGGPDSTALMHALARWSRAERGRPAVAVATIDHGLRPGSRAEAEVVGGAAAAVGLGHRILTWTRRDEAPASQDAARRARYRLLVAHAAEIGASSLLTAHTVDDQAETILIRLAAGSGLSGLAGMQATTTRSGISHHRPLLAIAKARLVATCQAEGWLYIDDPSNRDPRFARARWRALMPALTAEGLDAARLAHLAARLRRADEALDQMAAEALKDAWTSVDVQSREGAVAGCRPPRGEGGPGGAEGRTGDGPRLPGVSGTRMAPHPGSELRSDSALPTRGRDDLSAVSALDFKRLAAHPDEIVVRAVALALGPDAPIRLGRLESCAEALLAAARAGQGLRRTLAGRMLTLDGAGRLALAPEAPRSRGGTRPVTVPAAGTPHSLGNEGAGA